VAKADKDRMEGDMIEINEITLELEDSELIALEEEIAIGKVALRKVSFQAR
jgi:hypothetical protein